MLDSPTEAAGSMPVPGRGRGSAAQRPIRTDDVADLRAVLSVLRRRKLAILACAILVPLLAWLALGQMTPRYTATGTLLYDPNENKVREMQSILRADPVTDSVMASQAEILQSLHIAQKVAERGNLFDNPEFNKALRPPSLPSRFIAGLRSALGMEPEPAPVAPVTGPGIGPERNATILAVQAALRANATRFSRTIEVSFTAEDRLVAAAAVNNAMDVYVKDQYAAKYRAVRRTTEMLERRVRELRAEVRRGEDNIAAYRSEHRLSQGMRAGMDAEQISLLSEDLVRARGELTHAEGRLDAAHGKAGAGAQAAIAPSVVQLRLQQDQIASQVQARQARFGPNHPEAESLRRQLAEAQRAVAAETTRVVTSIESEHRSARARVVSLEQSLRDAQQETNRAGQAQIALNAMTRDVEASRTQLQSVLQSLQQTAQQAAVETSEAREISQALPSEHPSWPRSGPLMAGAVVSGLFIGLLLAAVLHIADTTLRSGEDTRSVSNLPCFALLPEVRRRALGHLSIEEYVARRPLTIFAEQVRALRAGLWFGANRPRVIAMTAARPAEGKTVVSIALGRSAAMSGERVLVIESDLRQPRFARRLGAQFELGLAEYLKGEALLEDVIQLDQLSGMHYIHAGKSTSGSGGAHLPGLFMSETMARMLATVRQDYDLVLLDAPPVQAMTEARVVAAIADATVLCVRWRSTPRATLRLALDLLEDAHANVVGTVLTRVEPRIHLRSGAADAEVYHRRYKQYFAG
jgi:capsular exopolysaccharide synthesis family protein